MNDLYTKSINEETLREILARVQKAGKLKPRTGEMGAVSLRMTELDDLTSFYEIDNFGISIANDGLLPVPQDLGAFWQLAAKMLPYTRYVQAVLTIAENGKKFDYESTTDFVVRFGYFDGITWVQFRVGEFSPGFDDALYRKRLFDKLFEALSLQDSVEISVVDNVLNVEQIGKQIRVTASHAEKSKLLAEAQPVLIVNPHNVNPHNPNEVALHGIPAASMISFSEWVIKYFKPEQLLRAEIQLNIPTNHYSSARSIVNDFPLGPWNVSFFANSPYTLSTLEEAVRKYDSFTIIAFSLRAPKIGWIDADLHYDAGAYTIHFYCDTKGARQSVAFRQLVEEIAGHDTLIDLKGN